MKNIITGLVVAGIISGAGAAESPVKAATPDAAAKEPAAITRTTVIPCPTPKPAFDHARIDRTLKEPKYVSEKPIYRFFVFGPEGKSVMAMVLDESKGTGKGYDVYYVDLNLDRDITGEGERFVCQKPEQATPSSYKAPQAPPVCDAPSPDGPPTCMAGLPPGLMKDAPLATAPVPALLVAPAPSAPAGLTRKLDVPDPVFDYRLSWEGGKWLVHTVLKSGNWHTRLAAYGGGNVWSADKARAPVYRFGGMEWDFHQDVVGGKTYKPGDNLTVETTAPFFAGSSPEVLWGQDAGCYVYGGYTHARYSLESLERPGEATRVNFVGNTCCGGRHVSRILIPANIPPGRAELVLSMDTPDSYLGRVVQRIPLTIQNPDYGKPVPELDVTAALRKEFPEDTVIELYQGADLSSWRQACPERSRGASRLPESGWAGEYDGARDTYIAGYPDTGEPNGAQSQGSTISYSYDCRNDLRVGSTKVNRTLLRFDLSMLPREAKVKKALLRLMATDVKPKVDRTTRVCVLKKDWHDDLSNGKAAIGDQDMEWFSAWYLRMPFPVGEEVRWEKPYAMGDSDRVREPVGTIAFAAAGWDGLDLTATVQQWVGGGLPNHGVVMELANPQNPDYAIDVNMVSSDHPGFPAWRPRLVLVLEKGVKPVVAPAVEEKDPDLEKARARAKAENKLLLCNILSRGSLVSRSFQQMLKQQDVQTFLGSRFVEIRIDADKPEHRKTLELYGVKYAPTALVIRPGATPEQDVFDRFEPLKWNTRYGKGHSWFENPGTYALHLEYLRTKGSATLRWRRLADGALYPIDEHLFYQRFDGNGGIVLAP